MRERFETGGFKIFGVPFARSYWVVPGKLLAGYYPGDLDTSRMEKKLKGLLGVGIRYVINLMEENEQNWDGKRFRSYEDDIKRYAGQVGVEITIVRRPIEDLSAPSPEYLRNILDEIDKAISQNKPVYVHCWGGKGRTGTVVGCYLARHGIALGKEALQKIKELRRYDPTSGDPSPETKSQRSLVKHWRKGE